MTWEKKTLSDVADFYNGKAHEKEISENGEFIVVNSKYISRDGSVIKRTKSQHFPLFHGDIVMVMSDVPNGKALAKCLIIDEDNLYSLNQRICCIRAKESVFIPFLKYQLNRNKYFLAFNNGETQTNLRKDDILDCPIYLPPLTVQKQIVEKLDTAFADIDKAISASEKNIENAKALLQKHLDGVFSDNDWATFKIESLCDFLNGYAFKSQDAVAQSSVQLLRMGNLYQNELDLNRKPVFYPEEFNNRYKEYLLNPGDILISLTGTVGKKDYGYAVEIPKTQNNLLLNQRLLKLHSIKEEIVRKEFLLYFLHSSGFLDEVYEKSNGTRQANVSISTIKNIVLPVPPLTLQESLVKQVHRLDEETKKLERTLVRKIAALYSLKSSILNQAFSGELTKDAA